MRRASAICTPTLRLSVAGQILGFLLLWLFCTPIEGNAQVTAISPTPPGAGGLRTIVTPSAVSENICSANCVITGGTRPGAGGNLFHSFGQFNIGTGDIATFQNGISFDGSGNALAAGLPTSNILARVTGINGNNPSLSSIYGTLQTSGFGSANLFMMNPAGFLFGPGATVNVGGMVAFTSADYLRLQDINGGNAGTFHADATRASVLTTAPVASYGFLGSNPGAITVQGSQFTVTSGQSLSLVGGDITIQSGTPDGSTVQSAKLSALGDQISLASVASPGEILAGTLAQAPNINGQSFSNLGPINITDQSVIDVSGNGGGTVLIRGGQFLLDNSTIFANVTGPGPVVNGKEVNGGGVDVQVTQDAVIRNLGMVETNVAGNATPGVTYGGVHVKADSIKIQGTVTLDDVLAGTADFSGFTGIRSDVLPGSTGNSGNIGLEANSIVMTNFGQLQAQNGQSTFVDDGSTPGGAGNTGNIRLTTNQELSLDLALIGTGLRRASGNAGNIELTSTNGNISISTFSGVTSETSLSNGNSGSITLSAPHGDILLDAGTVSNQSGFGGALGGIQITANNLQINGGSQIVQNPNSTTPTPPGDITITLSGNLSLTGEGSTIFTNALSTTPAGNVNITAHDVSVASGSFLSTGSEGTGRGGTLNISADTVHMTSGGQIKSESNIAFQFDPETFTFTPVPPSGAAGNINIHGVSGPATSVVIDGANSGIFTNAAGTAAAGSASISAQSLTIHNGGTISATNTGTAPSATGGTITVKADTVNLNTGGTMTATSTGAGAAGQITVEGLASSAQSVLIDGAGSAIFTDTHGTGAGGNIAINANSVTLQNSGALSAISAGTASSATGGSITVNAEHIAVNSQGLITADSNGIAPAGVIDINTGTLAINSGGQIRSSSGAETEQISALAFSLAAPTSLTGGTISIQGQNGNGSQADSLTIDGAGSGIFTQSTGNRPGGDINILTSQSVTMTNGASVSASSIGTGNAGNIDINAGNQLAMTNSSVTTEASQASGGAIKITTIPSGTVELTNSTISASVLDGTGGGGSVDIDPQFVILQNSQILANAVFGPGGNINITTNLLLQDTASVISASSQFGQQGTIFIQSPISPASGKILPLGQKPLIPATLLSQRCAALAGGNVSSFTVAGRDSLPAEPGGWVPTPLALSMAESNEGAATETALSSFSEMAEGTPLLSLRKIAPAGFLTQSFPVDWSDCTS